MLSYEVHCALSLRPLTNPLYSLSRHHGTDEAAADPERLGIVPQTPVQDEKGAGGRTIATPSRGGHGR